jgi:hypothetical protein
MHSLMGYAALFALVVGCSGTKTGNPVNDQSSFRPLGDDGFLLLDPVANSCPAPGTADPSKLFPSKQELTRKLGGGRSEFIILMTTDVSFETYPIPTDSRNASDDHPLYRARAEEIARIQGCAIESVTDGGGKYVQSFWLINGFVAELTVEQAVAISELPDVRGVQLSETESPPP